jgi:RNA polymerase sigma-70 factor, ECF subfamily
VLFGRYCRMVLTIGWKILRQSSDADDLVQEVFLSVLLRGNTYDQTKSSVKTWIAQLAYFTALTRRRNLYAKKTVALEEALSSSGDLQVFTLRASEQVQLVDECLAALNPRQRRTIELIHFEGYTLMETASVLKESLANTRNQYYRGMKSLRARLHICQSSGAKIGAPHPRLVESDGSEPLVTATEG